MFYQKYRPQTIEQIDNETIRTQLKNILSKKTISHSWLLTGPKGTGKTSTARLLAKSINCLDNLYARKGTSEEPCNNCEHCKLITSGNAIDVIEMDAASNRKIDDIRQLIDQVKFAPAHMRYKVYIIDEVHMLTNESFNALLKTLEEPPKSTIFILATTELDKLPKTIISRCLRLNFTHATPKDVVRQLTRIIEGEKLSTPTELLETIALHCDHSFRDAAKLLEEVTVQKITTIDAFLKLIGLASSDIEIMKFIQTNDVKGTLEYIQSYDQKGGNFRVLIEQMLQTLHEHLLSQNGIGTAKAEYEFNIKQTSKLIKLLTDAYVKTKASPIESLPLEIAIIEYSQSN